MKKHLVEEVALCLGLVASLAACLGAGVVMISKGNQAGQTLHDERQQAVSCAHWYEVGYSVQQSKDEGVPAEILVISGEPFSGPVFRGYRDMIYTANYKTPLDAAAASQDACYAGGPK